MVTNSRSMGACVASAALLVAAVASAPMSQADSTLDPFAAHEAHAHAMHGARSPLVDKVRAATARFLDVNVAMAEGWVPATPCVSGPTAGAMGVHFVLPSRVGDGILDASQPESLIYEPLADGSLRLVGVEFIVIAGDWARLHPDGQPPVVDGHLTNYVAEPNRYGCRRSTSCTCGPGDQNPNGAFADWNTRVSCEAQASR